MRANEFITERKKSRKPRKVSGYYFPGYGYYGGSGDSGESGDGGGGESVREGASNNIPTIGINVRSDGNIDYASLIVDGKKKYESRRTDSLRPYVGKTVGIVRTGNGPAVAIGQVTIGEPIEVDVEKFNKLRNQHLVPQGSKFDIESDSTKYLYPMISPVRWDNEKPIKSKGIVSRKIDEAKLSVDVPNEDWLQEKIDYAKRRAKGSKNMAWSPELNEVFTSNVSSEVVRATPDLYTTKATIGGRVIVFNAAQFENEQGESIWEIDFVEYEKNGIDATFGKTGSGSELQVFSFVIESIKDLIATYHPDELIFTSSKADKNRTKLYQRMMNRVKVPGYHAAPVYVSGEYADDYFYIVKDKLAEAEVATKNSDEIWRQLKAAGYQYVGSGADATVFAKDDSHVIKILMPEDMGTKAEQVFRKFYEFSMSHQGLACLPRFNEVNVIDINGKDYIQIEMEKLSSLEENSFTEGLVWLMSDYTSTNTAWDDVDEELSMPRSWATFSPQYANAFAKTWQSLRLNLKTYSMYKQLYTVMQLLYSAGKINKFGWDLHTANVMQRSNGQPVIIDPWFSEGTS